MKLYFYLLYFLLPINPSTLLEKLSNQSNQTKIILSIAALFPLCHAAHTQYHLHLEHENTNECLNYSRHHLQNIPYINILFYVNALTTQSLQLLPKYKKTDHKDICLFYKPQTNTRHYNDCPEECVEKHYYTSKEGISCKNNPLLISLDIINIISYLFLFGKLIQIH